MARSVPVVACRVLGCAVLLAVPTARASAQIHSYANLIVGDGVVAVKAGPGKRVYIGAAGPTSGTVTLNLDALAVDAFVTDAQALVARGTRPIPSHVSDRPEIQETESTRALSITRHVERVHGAPVLTYHIFVSDEGLAGFTLSATPVETHAVLNACHRAARGAVAMATPPDTTHHAARHPKSTTPAAPPAVTPTPSAAPQHGPN
jgi:hypothetical protein